jgi:hypothetical protein
MPSIRVFINISMLLLSIIGAIVNTVYKIGKFFRKEYYRTLILERSLDEGQFSRKHRVDYSRSRSYDTLNAQDSYAVGDEEKSLS